MTTNVPPNSIKTPFPSPGPSHFLLAIFDMDGIQVKGEVRNNRDGVRGLFATEDIAVGEPIMRIPPEAIINTGSSFQVSIVAVRWKSMSHQMHAPMYC